MQHANNVHTVSPHLTVSMSDHGTSSNTINGPADFSQYRQVATEFQKFSAAGWNDYIAAFNIWRRTVATIKADNHAMAVERRQLKKLKEHVLGWVQPGTTSPTAINPPNRIGPSNLGSIANVLIGTEAKVAVPPAVSTKPFEADKRANRKKVRDARTKIQANAAQAKAELMFEKTVPVIKAQRAAVQKIAELRPLHKAEEAAAKSAAVRAASIMKSSPDLVAEVRPDEGWKLVTRKKGARNEILASTTKMGAAGTQLHHATVTGDPALIRGAGKLLAATTRAPTATGGR